MKREVSHSSDQDLLLAVDGELSARVAARVQAHLSNCWACRTRRQELESAIADVIRIRQRSIDPQLPSMAGPRALLKAELARLAETPQSLWAGWLAREVPVRALTFAALVGLVLVAFYRLSLTPPVSANEVLARTRRAEDQQIGRITSPVIYQKLQLRRHSEGHLETATWEIWNDAQNQRLRQRADGADLSAGPVTPIPETGLAQEDHPVGDLLKIFNRHRADLGRPLCAANYETWRAAIPQVSEKVVDGRLPGGDHATILEASGPASAVVPADRQESQPNQIIKAELVVRTTDWHPVEERLWVDDREYEIAELDYRVLPLSEADAKVFAEPPAPGEPVDAPSPLVSEVMETPPPVVPNPNETEMAVRYELHRLAADLGEPIEISHDRQGKVMVEASGVAPELQARLRQQLASISNAGLDLDGTLRSGCEGCAAPSPEMHETAPKTPTLSIVPGVNPNERRLEQIFGDPRAQEAFTREVLAISGDEVSRGFALRNLALRYPPEEEARLTPHAKAQLKGMVDDHFAVLIEITNHLQGLLRPLLEVLSNSSIPDGDPPQVTAKGVQSDEAGASVGSRPRTDTNSDSNSQWQNASFGIFVEVQKADHLAKSLLSSTDNPMPADQVLPELRQALSEQQQYLKQYQGLVQVPRVTDR